MKALSIILHSRKRRMVAALAGMLLLLAVFCVYRAFFCPLAEGTVIGGVEVSNMPPAKARQLLEQELADSLYRQPLSLNLPEESLTLSPEDYGLQVNTAKALFTALHSKQKDTAEISLRSCLKADETALREMLEAYASRYDSELNQPVWLLEGDAPDLSTKLFSQDHPGQTLVLTIGTPSLHLDTDAVLEEILMTFSNAVALCEEERYQLTPEVAPEALPDTPDAAAIARELETDPVNDTVDRETFAFNHGSYGTAVDTALLQEKIRQAAYGERITIPLEYIPPQILGENAYFQDVLGAYETRHTNNENRNTNLRLQCEALDGLVLQPGEIFSMNACLGERSTERGYLPAPAYSGNRLVNSPGGGVCQGTTTLYNCVLLADLEVVFRVCHGVKVGYVPLGLDAAVNWLTTDFQFRNNFHFPIQLRAWLEDGYMKMQILGTDEKDYYIKMETGSGEDDVAFYARSYKCKYSKETDELISRDVEAYSTYYKNIG